MAQPFYNYGTNPYGGQNNGFMSQQPHYGNFYGQPQNMAQNPNNGVQQQYQQQQPTVIPPKTNMPLATSMVDAMNKSVEPNTLNYYADQDNPLIYLVSIDMQGRKTSRTFKVEDVTEQTSQQSNESTAPNIDLSGYAKKEDLKALEEKIMGMASAFVAPSARAKNADKPKLDKE